MSLGKIDGVTVQQLARHADDRGYFEELIRVTDSFFSEGFGQLSHSKMFPGVVKAWHIHKTQIDWWYVASGRLRVALHDLREGSPTLWNSHRNCKWGMTSTSVAQDPCRCSPRLPRHW